VVLKLYRVKQFSVFVSSVIEKGFYVFLELLFVIFVSVEEDKKSLFARPFGIKAVFIYFTVGANIPSINKMECTAAMRWVWKLLLSLLVVCVALYVVANYIREQLYIRVTSYACKHIHTYKHTHTYRHTHTYIHTHIHIYIITYTYTHTYTHTDTYIRTYIHINTYIIHTYMNTYTHRHT